MDRANQAYWTSLSVKWTVAPPLAPCEDDLRWFGRHVGRLRSPVGALLFGVTPGLATLAWPAGSTLVSLDWSAGMLGTVLPRRGVPEHTFAVLADWRELPIATRSCEAIVGDGCYTALGDPDSARLMNAEMARVLRPGGMACFRCFVRPERGPDAESLFRELSGRGPVAFDLFRWRLAIAVQGARWGVPLGEVWEAWNRRVPDRAAVADRHGWSASDLQRIERWKGEPARYAFASLAELEALAAPRFDVVESDVPSYARGEYFPRIALRARA